MQYREGTIGTSGETNFSGAHKEAVQPKASVLVPTSPLQSLLKDLVPQSPRGLAREIRARKNKNKVSFAAQSAGTDRRIVCFYKVYTLLYRGNVLRDCTDCPIVLWSDESHTFYDIDT